MTTTMNTNIKGIEVDHINGVIVVTKSFLKAAKNPSTAEFALLIKMSFGKLNEASFFELNETF